MASLASRYVSRPLSYNQLPYLFLPIMTEWTSDPARPPSPAYFRLLYMGKMLSDEQTLSGMYSKSTTCRRTDSMVAGLDMKLAPATTIIHLSVRTIPPEEGEHRPMGFFWVTADRVATESNKKSLLGFSLRPSIRGRNSSAGVPSLTSNQPSNPAGPISQPAPFQYHNSGAMPLQLRPRYLQDQISQQQSQRRRAHVRAESTTERTGLVHRAEGASV